MARPVLDPPGPGMARRRGVVGRAPTALPATITSGASATKRLKQAIWQVFRQRDVLSADAVALIYEFETRLAELDGLETSQGHRLARSWAGGLSGGGQARKRMGGLPATPGGAFPGRPLFPGASGWSQCGKEHAG